METAIIVGLNTGKDHDFAYSMEELRNLTEACEIEVADEMVQVLPHPVAATYIGSGKAMEIATLCEGMEYDYCIFDDTLSPAQLRNLQKLIPAKIMDRTGLILEIFAKRARTREAKLQVESANLQYTLPRLIGMWEAIGRQGGASGSKSSKGIGETQLELDRRWIQKRMAELRRELDNISHDREIQRGKRQKSSLPLVALVGYTNAGKSTVMNHFMELSGREEEKKVLEKDMLFATLDTSIRRIETGDRKDFLLSDTVGFVNKLPHALIKAFRSTLDEIKYADLLLEVVDCSDEHCEEQMKVTRDTLRELGADTIPIIFVMNKADKHTDHIPYPTRRGDQIFLSALQKESLEFLLQEIKNTVYAGNQVLEFMIPYSDGASVSVLNEKARIITQEYRENGVYLLADVPAELCGKYQAYIVSE